MLFTMYIALASVHALVLCGLQFISCVRGQWTECSGFSPPVTVILLIFLCLEGLLFFTFTAVMFGTQIHSICNDETEIERLKSEKPTWERRLRWEGMKSVFGGPFAALDEPLRRLPTAAPADETQERGPRVLGVRLPRRADLLRTLFGVRRYHPLVCGQ